MAADAGDGPHDTMPDMSAPVTATRPVMLHREGGIFRLSFSYDRNLVALAKTLPFASFDPESKSWTCPVSAQAVDALRQWHYRGYTDVSVDELLVNGEQIESVAGAVVSSGSARRPFLVRLGGGNDTLFSRLRSVPGARWERDRQAFSYPPQAVAQLAALVDRKVVSDPQRLLTPADVTVYFDSATGAFAVRGDERAQAAFDANFPAVDVLDVWRQRQLDVDFADPFTAEVYQGELARAGEGVRPDGLHLDLYPYQQVDVAVALERSGLLVASEPGTGKTAVAVAVGHELVANRQAVARVVVVVPGAVRTHWKREIERFTGADDVVVIDGDKKQRTAAYQQAEHARWLIVHYDVLHLDYAKIAPLVDGALLVADEVHRAKSPEAKRTKALRNLAQRAERRIGLSGTPVTNHPGEWFSVLSGFCIPGLFGSPVEFLNRYSWPGKFGGFEGARNLGELQVRSSAHVVRRRKADVAEHLPPLRVKTVVLDPDPAYAAVLRRAHKQARDEIANARLAASRPQLGLLDGDARDEIEAGAEMTAVGMLRLLCCSPRLVAGSESASAKALEEAGLIPDVDGPKLDELRTIAAEAKAAGERVVVFSSSRRMIELTAQRLAEDGVETVTYTGAMTRAERDAAVERFCAEPTDDDPGPTVFASTDAGSEGLNLGRHCQQLVNLDLPWTAATAWQRANRIHRVDTAKSSYLVTNLIVRGTLEDGILRMIEAKADLADALFGESDGRVRVSGRKGRNLYSEALADWAD